MIKSPPSGPFVYRLGHLVFNQARGVRLPYGLPLIRKISPCGAALKQRRLRQLACVRVNATYSAQRMSSVGGFSCGYL